MVGKKHSNVFTILLLYKMQFVWCFFGSGLKTHSNVFTNLLLYKMFLLVIFGSGLKTHSNVFTKLLLHINNTFSKDSSDCLSTLSTSIEFLRLLVVDTVTPSHSLTTRQLAEVLSWEPEIQHPLDDLEKLLEVRCYF